MDDFFIVGQRQLPEDFFRTKNTKKKLLRPGEKLKLLLDYSSKKEYTLIMDLKYGEIFRRSPLK